MSNKNLFSIFANHIIWYPTPVVLNYLWGFGSLSGIILSLQILTGIFLAMHYIGSINDAFNSVESIMRNVNNGWLLRYAHANGASFMFISTYIHIARGFFYKSYIWNIGVWSTGVIILLLTMGIAFIGYVLPWGQMSLWGATVITNLVTAIPSIGVKIAEWVWGGFAVGDATITRFFSIHFVLPLLLTVIVMLHLAFLHKKGSLSSEGSFFTEKINFGQYFGIKDLLGFCFFLISYFILITWFPNLLGHSDNYIEGNPLVTPAHIVPEWYFLPFYAILRACPNKIGGIISMGLAILILLILPFLEKKEILSPEYKNISTSFFIFFIFILFILGWLGGQPAEAPYVFISKLASSLYFIYIFIFIIFLKFI